MPFGTLFPPGRDALAMDAQAWQRPLRERVAFSALAGIVWVALWLGLPKLGLDPILTLLTGVVVVAVLVPPMAARWVDLAIALGTALTAAFVVGFGLLALLYTKDLSSPIVIRDWARALGIQWVPIVLASALVYALTRWLAGKRPPS